MSTAPDSLTHLPATKAAVVSTDAPVASAASDVRSPPAPLSPAAKRARLHRQRRREGIRPVTVLLRELDIEALLQLGHLKPELRENPEALARAVYCALDLTLDNEKCAIWDRRRART
jgi:hypothetical protein